jgi:hypothetical protein
MSTLVSLKDVPGFQEEKFLSNMSQEGKYKDVLLYGLNASVQSDKEILVKDGV